MSCNGVCFRTKITLRLVFVFSDMLLPSRPNGFLGQLTFKESNTANYISGSKSARTWNWPLTSIQFVYSFFNGAGIKSDCVVSVDGMVWNNTLELTLKEVLQSYLR